VFGINLETIMAIGALAIPETISRPEDSAETMASPRFFKATGARKTPQVEWVEIQVKSALNRVKGMSFDWSINPYRGCAHACVYCADGLTPILKADGSLSPLGDLTPGVEIYGTVRRGHYRHYSVTRVLAHWSTRKPAYRIILEDGTELTASEDHRFLSNRGWKFVTGKEQGYHRRPHLTTGNHLMGVGAGALAQSLPQGEEYKRGYLCGMIRGDGSIGSYKYTRRPRQDNVHLFRLALADEEALRRAKQYLLHFSIPTYDFIFSEATETTRGVKAIRTSRRCNVEAIRQIIQWPATPSLEWCRGFLAGIFDAEGSYSQGILRIMNTDLNIIEWIERCFEKLGHTSIVERHARGAPKPVHAVRQLGGFRQQLRFFQNVDPAITRKRNISGHTVKYGSQLRIVAVEPVGTRDLFDITTGTGDFVANGVVSHNCFARVTHWYMDQDGVNDWSSKIFVKVNAPEVLRKELSRPTWTRESVSVGTATDPYQAAEGSYRLTRQILEALRDFRTPMALITKSTMVVRDIDILKQLTKAAGATICMSITTLDPDIAREIEPDVPPPIKRLEAVRRLSEAGIRTAVNLAPVIPGITDNERNLEEVVRGAKKYGASELWANALHLGEVVRDSFFKYLHEKRPHLIQEYERMYPKRYAPREYQDQVQRMVGALKAKIGFSGGGRRSDDTDNRPSREEPVQLQLFGQLNV
jgi:DNA repair photolyase